MDGRKFWRAALWIGVCLIAARAMSAEGSNVVPGTKVTNEPQIDGVINEAEWAAISTFEGLQDSSDGSPALETGQFWLGYDDKYIYFAARLADREPGSIRAEQVRTNISLGGDDNVSLSLDPFGSLNSFNTFRINPKGATELSIAGGRAAKREWLGEFLASARVTATGWEAEARIPWKLMKLPQAGLRDLRFQVGRYMPRTQRRSVWRRTPEGQPGETPIWAQVDFPNIPTERTLKLLPFGITGYDDKAKDGKRILANAGLDFRTQLTDSMNLVGTVNPDFRSVENSILSLDFSYFERLGSETRPFFQEGSGFLQSLGGAYRTRRIRNIDVGVSTYGQINDRTSVGIRATKDFTYETTVATQVSYQPDLKSEFGFGYVGLRQKEVSNDTLILSTSRRFGAWGASIDTTQTFDSKLGRGSSSGFNLFRNSPTLTTYFSLFERTSKYRTRLGQNDDTDFRGFNIYSEFDQKHPRGAISETSVEGSVSSQWRLNGAEHRRNAFISGSVTWRNGFDLDISANLERFRGFDDETYSVDVQYPRGNSYRQANFEHSWGTLQGIRYRNYELSARYRPFNRLQLTGSFQHVIYQDTETQGILSANYDLGSDQSVSTRIVAREKDWSWYVGWRRSGSRGAEWFVLFGNPNSEQFEPSLSIKLSVPFEIKF